MVVVCPGDEEGVDEVGGVGQPGEGSEHRLGQEPVDRPAATSTTAEAGARNHFLASIIGSQNYRFVTTQFL